MTKANVQYGTYNLFVPDFGDYIKALEEREQSFRSSLINDCLPISKKVRRYIHVRILALNLYF